VKILNKCLFIILLLPAFALAGSQFCFERETSIHCQSESGENYSLNGSFVKDGVSYEFSARRAFPDGWCEGTVDAILEVMKSGNYCMKFEEKSINTELTIDAVLGKSKKWTYFQ
jgi:hypothetical protein